MESSAARINAKLHTVGTTELRADLQRFFQEIAQEDEAKTSSPFTHAVGQLVTSSCTNLFLAMNLAIRVYQTINEYCEVLQSRPLEFNSSRATDPILARHKLDTFLSQVNLDLEGLQKISHYAVKALENRASQIAKYNGSPPLDDSAYILWHCLDQAEKQHEDRYAQPLAGIIALFNIEDTSALKHRLNQFLTMLDELYALKKSLEKVAPIGLYVHRLKQYFPDKRKSIRFKPNWQTTDISTPAAVLKIVEPSNELPAACKAYQNSFLRITLLHQLEKSSAFKTYTDLSSALEIQAAPEFSATFTAEVPEEVSSHLLSWMNKGIRGIAETPHDKNHLAAFIHVAKGEQFLKAVMNFSQAIVLAVKSQKKPLESICGISPDQFSEMFTGTVPRAAVPEELSYEEVVARDNQRLKELEKINREQRTQQALATSTQALSAQLKQQNEQKQNEAKASQKEALLQKIGELGSRQQETLASFLDSENEAHKTFDEEKMCGILTTIGILEKTTKGFKIQLNHSTTSSHRSHDGKLDGHFCRDVREIFSDLGITPNTIRGRPNPETMVSRK